MQVHSCEFCCIFENDYVVVQMWTAAFDILGYPYVEVSSSRSTLKKCAVFSSIFVFIHVKLILQSCTTWGVYLDQYEKPMMKLLAAVFSQKRSIIDIWQGSKYGFAASFFNIFPLLLGYLDEYMNILFFFWKCAATLPMWSKLQILFDISLAPKVFALYWPWKYRIVIYLYNREAKKLT